MMQFKICKPKFVPNVSEKHYVCNLDCTAGDCAVVHLELVTSWPVTVLWIVLSWFVSALSTAAYVHPEWFVKELEHSRTQAFLRYSRGGLESTLGMSSVCHLVTDKPHFTKDEHLSAQSDIFNNEKFKNRSPISKSTSWHHDGKSREDLNRWSDLQSVEIHDPERVKRRIPDHHLFLSQYKPIENTGGRHNSNLLSDSYIHRASEYYEHIRTDYKDEKESETDEYSGDLDTKEKVKVTTEKTQTEHGQEGLDCHSFDEDFPNGAWQASYVLFGSGCVLLTWCSILAFCKVWIIGNKGKKLVALLIGRIQIVAVLLQIAGLSLFPLTLSSENARSSCGPDASSFHPAGCRLGWAYVAALTSTLLACYCPLLAHFSHYTRCRPCPFAHL